MLNLTLRTTNEIVLHTSDGDVRILLNNAHNRPWYTGAGVRLAIDAPSKVEISRTEHGRSGTTPDVGTDARQGGQV